ncbi:carboxypeptidase-like regulatory domain-containing protein [Olleya sp. Hel_I_94]|uniref:carboxypeptidase-like regulatory domain-containing protein n=1 Tax=Olleya sp. Hel_I_94 TaxID=1250001 RepID=UPI0028F45741|nr:carboxypeptidase-like regulatory domain-containing protein [Olleya sp. Hel_I_94]
MKKLIFITLLLVFQTIGFSQSTLSGTVSDSNGSLYSVSITIKDTLTNRILNYTYSDNNGNYTLVTKNQGQFNMVFNALGYKTKIIALVFDGTQNNKTINVVLEEQPFTLDEVVIKSERPMVIKKDTITFKTKYFTRGNEHTVEDLLKVIPGLNIDNEGTIKVGNKEIEKLMIDGDDLFEKGYKLLSKNMPAYPIETVEVLQNYSNNHLLKDIEVSDKVALNLKLNDKSKRIWFGNLEANIGNDSFYHYKSNLMNFGKKNKYYFLGNANSIGYNATGDIQQLIKPFRLNQPASLGDNQSVSNLIGLSASDSNFKKERTNFNNAELVSLNAIFNPSDKIKIKTLGFFNWDETSFFRNQVDNIITNTNSFTNAEDYKLDNKRQLAFGKLDFIYNPSKTKMLESTTKYNNGNYNNDADLVFNGVSTLQNLEQNNTFFDQKLNYTNKFKDQKVMLLTGRFITEKKPQNYTINQFLYQDLFPEYSAANNIYQVSNNQMQFVGVNAHILDRKSNGHLLELQFGNQFREDKLNTSFTLLEDNVSLDQPIEYQNQTKYQVNDLYFKSKYRIKLDNFALSGNLEAHQLFNTLGSNNASTQQTPFYINPSLGAEWTINSNNKIQTTYTYNTTNANVLDVYSDYVLTGFRSFSKGTNTFNQLKASSMMLNYQLGNWANRFFANTLVLYTKNHDFLSTNTLINQNYTQTQKTLIKDSQFLTINTKFDYYFKFMSSNLKLDLGYTKNEFKNVVNNSNLRTVVSNNYNYGLELRSAFKGVFNYHLGTAWTTNKIETFANSKFTNNQSFLDLNFIFNKKFDTKVKTERYHFGSLDTDNTYYFLDFETQYKLIDKKLTVGITGKNLFNTKRYTSFSISDLGSSTTEVRLLPRMVLLRAEYRF